MTTFSIKTSTGFSMDDAFALSSPTVTLASSTAWIVKDPVTGKHQNWYGTGFTYDANNQISGGLATKMVVYDAANVVQASAQFTNPWNFATQGASPSSYVGLLPGDDSIIGGTGNDILNGGSKNSSIPGLFNTGAGLSSDRIDYNYKFTTQSGTATGTSGYSVAAVGDIGVVGSAWLSDNATSHWLVPSSDRDQSYDQYSDGVYEWSLQFDLTGFNYNKTSFSGRVSVDNSVIIKLNGVTIGSGAGFGEFYNFNAASGFISGINKIQFIVTNAGNGYPYQAAEIPQSQVHCLASSIDNLRQPFFDPTQARTKFHARSRHFQ